MNNQLKDFYSRFDITGAWNQDPKTRMQHRMCFRNERSLYKRTSSLSGKSIISIYSPESVYKIYAPDEWWSDAWDAESYGRAIDFSKPFFEQLHALQRDVPRIALFNVNPYNSDYCQQAYNNKSCYLCTVVMNCEDSMYLSHANNIKDSFDCDYLQRSELCYDCIGGENLYGCIGSDNCHNSSELIFCEDCIGCKQCIGSYGLRNNSYCIFNVQYSKEEYEAFRLQLSLSKQSAYTKWAAMCRDEIKQQHGRADYLVNTNESTGNYLVNAHDCHNCFDSFGLESCTNCTWSFDSHHCAEIYGMGTSEWVYEAVGVEKLSNAAFCTFVSDSGNAFYSDLCFYCLDIFGCVGIRRKKYAILNKSYDVTTYETLKKKLIHHMKETGEWGQFFPYAMSPFAYNESVAFERYPLSKQAALSLGYRWQDSNEKENNQEVILLPDDSKETPPDVIKKVLSCSDTKKAYKVTPQEVSFYQIHSLPLPRACPDARYASRMKRRFS